MKSVETRKFCFGFCIVFFILHLTLFLKAQDSLSENKIQKIQLKGFVKDLQSAYFTDDTKSLITGKYIHNRINFRWNISGDIHTRLEARNRIYYGEQVKTSPQFGRYIDNDNGYIKLSHTIIDDTSFVFNTSFDRVLVNWSKYKWDITIGRQRINWGVNLVWNPNDIFNTFNYFDFDYEERPGCDAVRVQYTLNSLSSLEMAYKPAKKNNQHVGAIMYKTNFHKYDLQEFAGVYQEDIVIGTGWAGSIKQIGFKGEGSYFHSYKNTVDTNSAFISSIALDRSFEKGYFTTISYLFNSKGGNILYAENSFVNITLTAKNLMPFQHTFFFLVSKEINPLVNISVSSMFSPTKNTTILLPSANLSLSDNWDLSLIAQLFFADVNNTYRTLGNSMYLRLRWSY